MKQDVSFKYKIIKYNIRMNIINGVFAVITANLVTPYFAKFAERLGANDFQIGLLSSLPSFICIFALIPGAMMIESFKNKKNITGSIIFVNKVFYLLLAMVPFMPVQYRPWIFVGLVGLMNLPASLAGMGFQSSIGDIFDSESLGTAMSSRNIFSSAVAIGITLLSGEVITKLPKTDSQTILLYQILLAVTFFVGQGEMFSYLKFRGIKNAVREKGSSYMDSLRETLRNIPGEKNYIIFGISSLIFYFGWQMGWPLFNIYTINYLNANEVWISYISIAGSISSIAAYRLWAKFAGRRGNTFALFIATIGMSITPILYAISRNLITLVIFNILVGISTAGTTQILFNLLIEVTPNKNRTIFIAVYNTLINVSAAVSPLIGVGIKGRTNIYTALIIVSMLRFCGSIAFLISSRHIRNTNVQQLNI